MALLLTARMFDLRFHDDVKFRKVIPSFPWCISNQRIYEAVMPTSNSDSSFTHSCIKVPINPSSGLPSPSYERENDALLVMNSRKNAVVSAYGPILSSPSIPRTKLNKLSPNIKSCDSARPLKAFIDFYESIPDYGDLNHLSDEEFYRKIQHLKEKQKQYSSSLTSQCVEEDIKDAKPESRSKEVSSVGSNPCSDLHSGIVGVNCLDNRVKEKCPNSFKTRKQFVSNTSSQTFAKSRFESPKRCKVKKHHSSLEVSTSEESTIESIDNGKIHTENDDNTVSENDGFDSKMSLKKASDNNPPPQKTPHKKQQKELLNLSRDSSSKSTRKNHPQVRVSSGSLVDSAWDNFSIDDYYPKSGHSFSDSDSNLDLRCSDCPPPRQIKSVAWKDPKITVPVPFNMVSREKENREICQLRGELYGSKRDLSKSESKGFKTKPIPIESRIPLYDKILNEQETRRRMVKKQSMENLKAVMKPFSFVKRDEEEKRYLVTHSSPELRNISKPMKLFKAKPVPKNLFSSHVYQRMREDEFYRTLRKRIRSEELLRSSSLPPSMAAREKANLRQERFSMDEDKGERCGRPKRKRSKIPNYKLSHDILRMELEGRKNENITTTPQPFHLETAMIHEKKSHKCCHSSCKAASLTKDRDRPASAGPLTLHRNNLASVLRIQSSRDRAEQERIKRREERRQREEARLREREFRKDPAWKLVSGWGGVEDDLALRACTRREEERIRNQIHHHQMENMMKRVYQIPTLFERQSQVHLSRKAVKEVLDGKMGKEQPKDSKSGGKSRKLSVKLQSKGVNSISPTPREEVKEEDSDEYYESDPEDDKTCHHSLGEDVEEGTGLEDEIKDEVVEDEKEEARESSPTHESQKLLDLPEENEGSDGKNEVGDVD